VTTFAQYRNQPDFACSVDAEYDEWIIAPVGTNRDAGFLTESNWDAQLKALAEVDADGNDYQQFDFNHWACGWVALVLVRPDSECAKRAEELAKRLDDYPLLDEDDFSEREWSAYAESWNSGDAQKDLVWRLKRSEWAHCVRTLELIGDGPSEVIRQWFEELNPSGCYYDESGSPAIYYTVQRLTSADLVALVRLLRKSQQVS
jgi:hypothetical protein